MGVPGKNGGTPQEECVYTEDQTFRDKSATKPYAQRVFIHARNIRGLLSTIGEALQTRHAALQTGGLTEREAWIVLAQNMGMLDPTYHWPNHTPTSEDQATPEVLEQEYCQRVELALDWFQGFLQQRDPYLIQTIAWLAAHVGVVIGFTTADCSNEEVAELFHSMRTDG